MLRITTANLDFATGAKRDREHLAHLALRSDVILVQEAKNVDLAKIAPDGWGALQDTSSESRAGSAILYRESRVAVRDFELVLGVRPRGVKMLTRWIACAHADVLDSDGSRTGEHFFLVSAHLPPQRYAWLQPIMVRRLKKLAKAHKRIVLGVDANMDIKRLGKRLKLKARGKGIIGVLYGPWVVFNGELFILRWGMRHGATDHPTVTASLRDARP